MKFQVSAVIMFVSFCCAYIQATSNVNGKRYLLIQTRKGNHVGDDGQRSLKEGIILINVIFM